MNKYIKLSQRINGCSEYGKFHCYWKRPAYKDNVIEQCILCEYYNKSPKKPKYTNNSLKYGF